MYHLFLQKKKKKKRYINFNYLYFIHQINLKWFQLLKKLVNEEGWKMAFHVFQFAVFI